MTDGRGITTGFCGKCGEKYILDYNGKLCPDCAAPYAKKLQSSDGKEDMVTHFKQDIGFRLTRWGWGHFSS